MAKTGNHKNLEIDGKTNFFRLYSKKLYTFMILKPGFAE